SWNSSMNTARVRDYLREKDANGEYKLPFLVVVDAFHSEMVGYADLVLPDTTYLERHDCISLLDRPISEPDAICDSIRTPVLEPDRDVRPWQEVMIDLAVRLRLPAFTHADGSAEYDGYRDFITRFERAPGVGFLAGWRGENGDTHLRGAPNPHQWQAYEDNECFFKYELPEHMHYYRFANKGYLEFAKEAGFNASANPIVFELYSEPLQRFRLAGQGLYEGPQPASRAHKHRLATYFDPLPLYYPVLDRPASEEAFPLHAITQRPMFMYHSWDSQNAWLRQITAQNYLYVNRGRAERMGIADYSWVWLSSRNGRIRVQVKLMEGVHPDTVWTWNAIGKQRATWGLSADANESNEGFLLNHLISELLPPDAHDVVHTNSDPITGQAAWYDLRVKMEPAAKGETGTWPGFEALPGLPDSRQPDPSEPVRYHSHVPVRLNRND
ncbi:MAG: molybdopterin oxidoreductase family protein, partial [Gammaproteobacteria bacterium]